MRTFVIGDVHGCLPELEALVAKCKPVKGDRFAFLGDIVDKGPDSIPAIEYIQRLMRIYPGSLAICGNHEESAFRTWDKYLKAGSWDGIRKLEREPWLVNLTQDLVDWMKSLPLLARPSDGVLLVHGGLFPAFFFSYDEIGPIPVAWHKGGGKKMDRARRFLRIRHVYKAGVLSAKGKDMEGQMVSLGDEGPNTQRWADCYDGREGFVFYGHDPSRSGEVKRHNHAMGLDTGCVAGARLSAAVLVPGQNPRDSEIISVPGKAWTCWLDSAAE